MMTITIVYLTAVDCLLPSSHHYAYDLTVYIVTDQDVITIVFTWDSLAAAGG